MPSDCDIAYRPADSVLGGERCRLDIHHGADPGGDVLIWLHGGGLVSGDKEKVLIGPRLTERGWTVVSLNYRFLQHAPWPACIQDAAAATAFVHARLLAPGRRLFISGASAGAYLAAMVALDRDWLAAHRLDPAIFSGVIPISGNMVSHFAYRAVQGIPEHRLVVDRSAPLFHVRADAPPMLLITAEDDIACRREENLLMTAAMHLAGHRNVAHHEIPGRTHATIAASMGEAGDPVAALVCAFIGA